MDSLEKFFKSENFKLLIKSSVEESLSPLNERMNRLDECLENLKKQIEEKQERVDTLVPKEPKPEVPKLQLEIEFAIEILKNQDLSKPFIMSPLAFVLGIYPFYKHACVETRKKIASFFLENDTDEAASEHFLDLLNVLHEKFSTVDLIARKKVRGLHPEIANKFHSTELKYLELEKHPIAKTVDESSDTDSENDKGDTIANTMKLNLKWRTPFSTYFSFDGYFRSTKTEKRREQFMKWPNCQHDFYENDIFQMVRIPMENEFQNEFQFDVLLPKNRFGLAEIFKNFNAEQIYLSTQKYVQTFVDISIPKFKINTEMKMEKLIDSIGIDKNLYQRVRTSLWEEPITNGNEDSFVHKSKFEINETGINEPEPDCNDKTKGCQKVYNSFTIEFVADHPFIFMIQKDEHLVFFGCYQ